MNLLSNKWKVSGIYLIVNCTNGKFYIGSTKCFKRRNLEYRTDLSNGKCHNKILQRSFDRGDQLLMLPFHILDYGMQAIEMFYIETLKPQYNLKKVQLGRYTQDVAESVKKKIGDGNRGKFVSEETRKRISLARSSRVTSQKERESRRQAALKRWADPEKRKALIESQNKARQLAPPRKYPGRVLSDEHRKKLSESAKRRWQRERDLKRNLSE